MNRTRKGNYYRNKTKKWYEDQGYMVAVLEHSNRIFKDGKVIFRTSDIWGCDLMAKNSEEIIFIQCKTKDNLAAGIKELKKFEPWPLLPGVVVQVVYWESRAKEPTIVEV